MSSTPYLYLYTTPLDPPNWRLGTQIYHAIGKTLEYLLETAEVTTAVLTISILCLCLWKKEVRILPIIGVVGVCLHEWALVFTLVLQVSFILLALGGMVNLVLWKLFLKGFWRRVCRGGRWDAELFARGVFERVFGAVACWSCWYEVGMGIARLLDWVAYVGSWIAHLPELPKVYWKKWVSESWVSVWAHILISHFGRKHHEAAEGGNGEEDLEITTHIPEPAAAAPTGPILIRPIHCTGSTFTDYVNPYPSSPPSCDLLLPESYPLPIAIVPDTPTVQQLHDEDPFQTPLPPRAGDPGFLDAYPSPEGGSKWQRSKKSFAEKEMERWKLARKIEPKAPKVPVREFKPSPGSEPGFLDAYPCPQPVPTKWLEDDVEGNAKRDGNEESDNSEEGNRPHENHPNQPVTTHADGNSTTGSNADADKHEKSPDTTNISADSQETIELCSDDRIMEAAESAIPGPGVKPHQNYIKLVKTVDLNRRGIMRNNAGAEGNAAGGKRKAYAERSRVTWKIVGKWDHRQDTVKPVAAVGGKVAVAQPAEASTHAANPSTTH